MRALIIGSVALVIFSAGVGIAVGYGLFHPDDDGSEASTESAITESPITEPATTTSAPSTTMHPVSQDYIAYAADASIPDNHYIYVHKILEHNAQPILKLSRPFYSKLPYVTYNRDET